MWNVLRGASIVADDDVILEELRVSYERIILALTQFAHAEKPNEDAVPTTTTDVPNPSTSTASSSSAPTTTAAGTTGNASSEKLDNEKKLRKRISAQLELDENVAWDIFCSYMMFEYRGGSTSFEKLLEAPRVSTDFLTDLQQYYQNERLSVVLVIQAIFGYASQPGHKYNVRNI